MEIKFKKEDYNIEEIKKIYDQVSDYTTYLKDSTIKTLVAISIYRFQLEHNKTIPVNAFTKTYASTAEDAYRHASYDLPKSFLPFETIIDKVLGTDGLEQFISIYFVPLLEINIVKVTCAALDVSQKELAEKLGSSEGTIRNWSSSNNPPDWATKFMNLLLENQKNKLVTTKLKELIELIK